MIEIARTPAQNLVTMRVSGKLSAKDYNKAIPELEQAIQSSGGELNAVITLDDLRGWDIEALWKDLKFDVRHYDDFRRIGVVGQSPFERAGTEASTLLTAAEIKFFPFDQSDEAHEWATAV